MGFRVLIVDDKEGVGNLLHEHLTNVFRNGAGISWPPGWPSDANRYPTVEVLGKGTLDPLLEAKRAPTVARRLTRAVETPPDVVITDLALSDEEVKELDKQGGTNSTGEQDPTSQLAATTGFQILTGMAPTTPVIATTYASNPRIFDACWQAGAHAVARKPAKDEQMSDFWEMAQRQKKKRSLTAEQEENARTWGPQIETYLRTITQEVVKAVQANAFTRMQSAVPRQLPFWLALDRDRLEPQHIDGTSLMLLEPKGLPGLFELGREEPRALFALTTRMWDHVQTVLAEYNAEINHFSGHTALIFHGVYGEADQQSNLQDTLLCASRLLSLFEQGGPIRESLDAALRECEEEVFHTYRQRERHEMAKYIEQPCFGATVLSVEPRRDAIYGRVGTEARWQHTVQSRYFDLLRSAQTEIHNRERESVDEFTGRSILIHDEEPRVDGFEIIAETPEPESRELAGFNLLRVVPSRD